MKQLTGKPGLAEKRLVTAIKNRVVDLRSDGIERFFEVRVSTVESGGKIAKIGRPPVLGKVVNLEKDAVILGCKFVDGPSELWIFPQ